MSINRSRWAAIGAAVAVTLGAGGIGLVSATNPADALTYIPIAPCRLIDTRADSTVGTRNTPLRADDIVVIDSHGDNGQCVGIPATARGLSLNVTAIGATQPTFLTIWPNNAAQPTASSLNPVPGEPPTPNAVVTKISNNGRFAMFNKNGSVDVIIDVNGYYVDHDHDDRYYTEDEIDLITELAPVAGGFIDADGNLGRNVGVESATFVDEPTNTDHYDIVLTGIDYSAIEYVTHVTTGCPGADASVQAGPDGHLLVYVERVGATDTLGKCGFGFTVTPLPAG